MSVPNEIFHKLNYIIILWRCFFPFMIKVNQPPPPQNVACFVTIKFHPVTSGNRKIGFSQSLQSFRIVSLFIMFAWIRPKRYVSKPSDRFSPKKVETSHASNFQTITHEFRNKLLLCFSFMLILLWQWDENIFNLLVTI